MAQLLCSLCKRYTCSCCAPGGGAAARHVTLIPQPSTALLWRCHGSRSQQHNTLCICCAVGKTSASQRAYDGSSVVVWCWQVVRGLLQCRCSSSSSESCGGACCSGSSLTAWSAIIRSHLHPVAHATRCVIPNALLVLVCSCIAGVLRGLCGAGRPPLHGAGAIQ